jgi:hypothetical protein
LTRDILGLPADTPIGDPALLVPLLHRPRPVVAHTVCVPHFHDETDDADLLGRTGVSKVLRARVAGTLDALLEVIDVIAGAEFVLAGALHAAILACAYGRPFAFYDSGRVDLPFKWADFSASIGVPTVFVRTLAKGRSAWDELLAPVMRRPAVTPVLEVFPGVVRPALLAMARAWDGDGASAKRGVDR